MEIKIITNDWHMYSTNLESVGVLPRIGETILIIGSRYKVADIVHDYPLEGNPIGIKIKVESY